MMACQAPQRRGKVQSPAPTYSQRGATTLPEIIASLLQGADTCKTSIECALHVRAGHPSTAVALARLLHRAEAKVCQHFFLEVVRVSGFMQSTHFAQLHTFYMKEPMSQQNNANNICSVNYRP